MYLQSKEETSSGEGKEEDYMNRSEGTDVWACDPKWRIFATQIIWLNKKGGVALLHFALVDYFPLITDTNNCF